MATTEEEKEEGEKDEDDLSSKHAEAIDTDHTDGGKHAHDEEEEEVKHLIGGDGDEEEEKHSDFEVEETESDAVTAIKEDVKVRDDDDQQLYSDDEEDEEQDKVDGTDVKDLEAQDAVMERDQALAAEKEEGEIAKEKIEEAMMEEEKP